MNEIRSIRRIVTGKPATDGAGVKLVRVIGYNDTQDFDPFLMLDAFVDITVSESHRSDLNGATSPMKVSHRSGGMEPVILRGSHPASRVTPPEDHSTRSSKSPSSSASTPFLESGSCARCGRSCPE